MSKNGKKLLKSLMKSYRLTVGKKYWSINSSSKLSYSEHLNKFETTEGRLDIQHNDIQLNNIQHKDIQHNDIQQNDIQQNDIQHNDIQHNDFQHK